MTDPSTDVPEDVPEAAVPQVQQLLNTRANAIALGQADVAASTARQLAALGVNVESAEKKDEPTSDAKGEAKADDAERALAEARQSVPQGRTTREQQQTTTDPSARK